MQQENTARYIDRNISRFTGFRNTVIIAGILLGIIFIITGYVIDPDWYWGLTSLVPLIIIGLGISSRLKTLRNISQVLSNWGKPQPIKKLDFSAIRLLSDNTADRDTVDVIDDQTWKDLNMDEIYSLIDRTLTDPGQAVLYRMLRIPLFNKVEIQNRSSIIRIFQEDRELRERLQYILCRLGRQYLKNDLFSLLWGDSIPGTKIRPFYTLMALAALFSLFVPIIWNSAVLVMIPVLLFIINLCIHYISRRKYKYQVYSFPYLLTCIRTAKELSHIREKRIETYTREFDDCYKTTHKILNKTRFLFPGKDSLSGSPVEIMFEYLNILFLLEVRAFYSATAEMNREKTNLRKLYTAIGEIDSLLSIASWRESLSSYTEPEFTEDIHLEMKNTGYPLLQNPVPASVEINRKGVIITGSNMSGKSTFLRNVGCNVLLAQTTATCPASYYSGSLFRVMTSISRTDDVIAGKSFYYVEAERILKTIDSLDNRIPSLCIIDELLSGTNSSERLRASDAIIRFLLRQNALVICATHDLELIERLNGLCDLYHFTGTADENGLKFDYLLKPGPATTQNAIELLEYLGYPGEIVKRAKNS